MTQRVKTAMAPTSTSTSSNIVDWIETKSQVATVPLAKEAAYSSEEELFATVLFKTNFALLCQICHTSNPSSHLSTSSKRDLDHARDRMRLWGDALGEGRLEACLSPQDELHTSLISLLNRIGKSLLTVIEQSISVRESKKAKWNQVKGLRELLSKAASILSVEESSSNFGESDSDSTSESDDEESEDMVVAGIRSLQLYSKLLMDLCPTLEQAFSTRQHKAGGEVTISNLKSFEVTESALPWVRQVYEKFRAADNGLLERLGEANWQRFVRIRASISNSATAQESFKETQTIFKPSTVHTFRDSALGASIPSQSVLAGSVASHTSFVSSVEGEGKDHLAVPRTPQQISQNEPFNCSFCGYLLKKLRNRIDWKMHVFSDLQAYICTFNDCHERSRTFPTRKLWSQHELESHFSDKSFRCRDCQDSSVTFPDEDNFLDHLSRTHGRKALTHVHALGMVQAAAESVPRSFADQECPLCAQTKWKSQREYFTHVGKHLEQISLAALPQDDDEDEVDSDESDEDKYPIKCVCGLDREDRDTVFDKRCNTRQHISCYYEKDWIPEEHLCVDCSPRKIKMSAGGLAEDLDHTIRCLCGFTFKDGTTICCEKCETWQHIQCYYPDKSGDPTLADLQHLCIDCHPRILDKKAAFERQRQRIGGMRYDLSDEQWQKLYGHREEEEYNLKVEHLASSNDEPTPKDPSLSTYSPFDMPAEPPSVSKEAKVIAIKGVQHIDFGIETQWNRQSPATEVRRPSKESQQNEIGDDSQTHPPQSNSPRYHRSPSPYREIEEAHARSEQLHREVEEEERQREEEEEERQREMDDRQREMDDWRRYEEEQRQYEEQLRQYEEEQRQYEEELRPLQRGEHDFPPLQPPNRPDPINESESSQGPAIRSLLGDSLTDKPPATKMHKCPYCDAHFTGHFNLKSHLLTHSQEKPYQCMTCSARFRRLHDLKRHTLVHTGERPHVCDACGASFARREALARHHKSQGCPGHRNSPPIDEHSGKGATTTEVPTPKSIREPRFKLLEELARDDFLEGS